MECSSSPIDKPIDTALALSERIALCIGPALFVVCLVAPWVETTLTRGGEVGLIASVVATLSGSRDPSITAPFLVALSQLGVLAIAIFLVARVRLSAPSAIWGLIVFGILIRGVLVGGEITGDEAYSWITFIRPGPLAAITQFPTPNNNLLFSLVAALMFRFTGSILAVQWMTLLISIAAVWGLNSLMEEMNRPLVERLLAISFLTTSVLAIECSIQFRGYGPMITCTTFLLASFLKACRNGEKSDWFVVSIWSALAVGFHLFSVFVPIFLFGMALIRASSRGAHVSRQRVFQSSALFAFLVLLMFIFVLPDMVWYFLRRASSGSYQAFSLSDLYRFFFGSGASSVLTVIVVGLGAVRVTRGRDLEMLGVFFGPLILAVGFVVSLDLFSFARFFLFALPFLAVLGAIGAAAPFLWLSSLRQQRPSRVLNAPVRFLVLVLFSIVFLFQSWRGLDQFFERSHAAMELQHQLAGLEGTEILVAGRFYPLVKFYVPPSVPLRKLHQLESSGPSYVVVFDQRDTKWISSFPGLVEELEKSHSAIWEAQPYATKRSHFRGTVVLRRDGGTDPG
jgi:hypothetical protein